LGERDKPGDGGRRNLKVDSAEKSHGRTANRKGRETSSHGDD